MTVSFLVYNSVWLKAVLFGGYLREQDKWGRVVFLILMKHLRWNLWNSPKAFHCTQPVRGLATPSDRAATYRPQRCFATFSIISAHKTTIKKKKPCQNWLWALSFCLWIKATHLEGKKTSHQKTLSLFIFSPHNPCFKSLYAEEQIVSWQARRQHHVFKFLCVNRRYGAVIRVCAW